jgi:hypothetical protein
MAKRIRVYEVHSGRILKTLPSHYTVASINDFIVLYAEKIPDEELEMADSDQLLPCFHFDKDPSKTHNVPFYFIVKEVGSAASTCEERALNICRARHSKIPRKDCRRGLA